jgi:hypothetical protein
MDVVMIPVPLGNSGLARPTLHDPGGLPLLATPIAAEGVAAIKSWVAAIRPQEVVTGLCGRLLRRSGAPIRRSSGIQPAVVPSWGPGAPLAALVAFAASWSLPCPHGRPAFGSGQRPLSS